MLYVARLDGEIAGRRHPAGVEQPGWEAVFVPISGPAEAPEPEPALQKSNPR